MNRPSRALVAASLIASSVAMAGCGVLQSEASTASSTHTYYIAADEVIWDYASSGINRITGEPFGEAEAFWVESGPHRIGKVYKKALFREYTDETFTTLKPRPSEWEHLGMLGPLMRAEVGDTLRIVYRTTCLSRPAFIPTASFTTRTPKVRRTRMVRAVRTRQTTESLKAEPIRTCGPSPKEPDPVKATRTPCCGCTIRTPMKCRT